MQRGGHGAVDLLPVCLSLCFNRTVFNMDTEFIVCPLNPKFRKTGLPPDLCLSGNACVIQRYFPNMVATFMNYNK